MTGGTILCPGFLFLSKFPITNSVIMENVSIDIFLLHVHSQKELKGHWIVFIGFMYASLNVGTSYLYQTMLYPNENFRIYCERFTK